MTQVKMSLLCLLSCLACTAEAQEPSTAEEIIAKHVEAIGGRAALDSCKTMRTTGKMVNSRGLETAFVYEVKQPDSFRIEAKPTGSESIVQASDGQISWWVILGRPQEMPEVLAKHLKNVASIGGPLGAYRANGHRVELIGKEHVNDRQGYKLKLICKEDAEGDEEFYFIDAETFLLSRVEGKKTIKGRTTEYIKTFSDYRRVDGLMLAFGEKEKEREGRGGPETVRTVERVEVNVDLPDERFAMPKLEGLAEEDEPVAVIENDPAGRALYDAMIAAMRAADTLSFKSQYHVKSRRMSMRSSYHMWLKKPNHFRMEGFRHTQDEPSGILVGDGNHLWIYWPKGCPFYRSEDHTEYEKASKNVYLKKPAPQGRHSIGHEARMLGAGILMTILDLSTFHGYTDSLQPYLDAVACRGVEQFGDEDCDVIEVSYMDAQRTWKIWIARRDQMPRKLEETVRVANTVKAEEIWTDIKVNKAITDEKFVWKPPEGWKEWHMPWTESQLLKVGTVAPDFELKLADGGTTNLQDYRDKVVMLVFWRVG